MTPLSDFDFHHQVILCHQSPFFPWNLNSQWTTPTPTPWHATTWHYKSGSSFILNITFLNPAFSQDIDLLPDLSQQGIPLIHLLVIRYQQCCLTRHHQTISLTHSKSIFILLKPDPENASPDSSGALSTYVPIVTGIHHSSLSFSNCSWWKACAKDMFLSMLVQCDFNQEFLAFYFLEASFVGDPAANHVGHGYFFFLSLDILGETSP